MEFSFKAEIAVLYLLYLLQKNGLSTYPESEKLGSITILNSSSSVPISFTSYHRCLLTRLVQMKALLKSSVETQASEEFDEKDNCKMTVRVGFRLGVHGVGISMCVRQLSQRSPGSSPADRMYVPALARSE